MSNLKQFFSTSLLIAGAAFADYGNASVLTIDDFSDSQAVKDTKSAGASESFVANISGTSLSHVSRTLIAEATTARPLSDETIDISAYSLKISNGVNSTGIASILWIFDPANFTAYGKGIGLEVLKTDENFSLSVEMVVNSISSSGPKTFSKTGDILFGFNDFSDLGVFTEVSSLRLNFFNGSRSWDGEFRFSNLVTPQGNFAAVPLPPAFVLMGSVLLGFISISRKGVSGVIPV